MDRRRFLTTLAGASLITAVRPAWAAGKHYDVSYIWTPDRSNALDYLTQVKELLGLEVAVRLELVRNQDDWYGVIYNLRYGSRADAEALAARHEQILRAALGGDEPLALPVPDQGYDRLYNVSYGLGPNREALQQQYAVISQVLGAGVTARLYIEQTDRGNYALVYKRYGDLQTVRDLAEQHGAMLKDYRIDASFIPERNNAIVYGATTQGALAQTAPKQTGRSRRRNRAPSGNLKRSINDHIQAERRRGIVAGDEETSWLVYDLKHDRLLASINKEHPRQCASMVKPLVALAFFHEAQRGRFIYGPMSNRKFTAMIQHSSNSATNWAMQQIGGPTRVQKILSRAYGRILQNISIVEEIGEGGRTYRNRASAGDYARFLRALWRDELPFAQEIKRLMNLPGRDRLYYGAPHIPVGTEVYNKTGSTSRLCGDMGILVAKDQRGRRFPYIMIGIIEKKKRASNYGKWIYARAKVIRAVSDLSYVHLKHSYKLR